MTGHALLRDFIAREGLTPTSLAKKLGRSVPLVWMWLNDECKPGLANALLLESATGGAVKATDWVRTAPPSRTQGSAEPRGSRKPLKRVRKARSGLISRRNSRERRGSKS